LKRLVGGYCRVKLAEHCDEAGIPHDDTSVRWIQDGGQRTWASYDMGRLLRKESAGSAGCEATPELRQARIGELEKVFGFGVGHTIPAIPSSQAKTAAAYRLRREVLEKSSVPRLLWAVLRPALEATSWGLELPSLATYLQREQSNCHLVVAALGFEETIDGRPAATTTRPTAGREWNPGQQMVHAYLQSLGSRGSDVNLSTGAMSRPRGGQQQSMETTLWKWKLAYKWHWQMSGSLQHEGNKGETSHEFKSTSMCWNSRLWFMESDGRYARTKASAPLA